jgi:hypothetical protein
MVDSVRLECFGAENRWGTSKAWSESVAYLFAMPVALCVSIFRWTSSKTCALTVGDMAVKHCSEEYQVGSKICVFRRTV